MIRVISYEVTTTRFMMKCEENGSLFQRFGERLPLFKKYKNYGYGTEAEMVSDYYEDELDLSDDIAKYNRAEGYKYKLELDRINEIIKNIKVDYQDLKRGELEDIAYEMYYEENQIWKIKWIRLNVLEEKTLTNIKKRKLIINRKEFKELLSNSNLKSRKFKTITEASKEFEFNHYGIGSDGWSKCSFIKEHLSRVTDNKVLSFDPIKKTGYVFDIFDLSEYLFSLNKEAVLNLCECIVRDFELYNNEIKRFKKAIKDIDKLAQRLDLPYMNKLLKNVWEFYKAFLNIGLNLIGTKYFKDERGVFFCSTRELNRLIYNDEEGKKIGDMINTLCVVGLLHKIKVEDLPESLKYDNKKSFENNYFMLSDWTIRDIESKAKLLVENNISVRSITHKKVSEALSIETANQVFNKRKTWLIDTANDDEDGDIPF